jgi:S1-C subfamily serine protease
VSFGTVPDFAFPGPGARVGGVVPGSPAEKAGIKEGDVMMKLDATDLTGLQSFSEFLKTAKAGQTVTVSIMRDGKPLTLSVTLAER